MKRTPLSLRRLVALASGLALGLGGAVAVTTPAAATGSHFNVEVSGTAECDTTTGTWNIVWTVTNTAGHTDAKVTKVDPASEVSGIAVDDEIPAGGSVEVTQQTAGDAGWAWLTVELKWVYWNVWKRDWDSKRKEATAVLELGECVQDIAVPSVSFVASCDGVSVKLFNAADATKDAEFVVTGDEGFSEARTVAPDGDDSVDVPAANAANVTVTEGGAALEGGTFNWVKPEECVEPSPEPEPEPSPAPEESPEPGEGGGLPVTGASTGVVAGIALLLVAFGAAMYLVARRRRIRFTA